MIEFKCLDSHRLDQALATLPQPLAAEAHAWLDEPGFDATLAPQHFARWQQLAGLDGDGLMLALLPLASCLALPGISNFHVGAVLLGRSGRLYLGANLEFRGQALAHTVHAEQSAITNAWLNGETGLDSLAVNYSPCGHCRQFMNELVAAPRLRILLPGRSPSTLAHYLPDAFGPGDLDIGERLLAGQDAKLALITDDPVAATACQAASLSHAPYSGARSGVALAFADGTMLTGRYSENAAFNPSLAPLQGALNAARLHLKAPQLACRLVLAEKRGLVSQQAMTADLARALGLPRLEYLPL